ncbi:hypothetical protein [Kytococcus sedentarius]|uniref:hypothetical protein n=1 Tax=Kytococcus sedentarius TaxID=1276 RepID=UPI0035BC33EB
MALSEEERSRLDALERSLLSSGSGDDSDMPEVERSARPDSQDPFGFLTGGHPGHGGADPFAGQSSGARRVSLRSSGRVTPARIGVVLALGLAGVALYVLAVWSQIPWFGAGGFVLWILAVAWWLRAPSAAGSGRSSGGARPGRRAGRGGPAGRGPASSAGPRRSSSRRADQGEDGSFMQRLEGRWDARRNDRDA